MNIKELLRQLTVEEKAALVAGRDFMYTNSVARLGIPSIRMSDGPHGLRVQTRDTPLGAPVTEKATAFPTAAATASSWNPDNTERMGRAIAEECLHYGISVLLGPGANIKRNPLGGRNFEYFSEDPLLSAKMAAAEIRGVQSKGIGVSLKHFALNNSENYRLLGDSVCDMRAMREIYLKSFERIVKESRPQTVMCAYNKINGCYCSQNKWLLEEVLRREWGFEGLVMTDWGAAHDRVEMLRAGLDLEMPGDTAICRKWIVDGIASGELAEADLNRAAENVLRLVAAHENDRREEADFAAHNELAAQIAADSAVLLKNDGILPLDKGSDFCAVGELFEKPRYQGAGSSMISPYALTSPKDAFERRGLRYCYAKGYRENQSTTDEALINEALAAAEKYTKVLVFAGLTDFVESEGCDREDMRLPPNQLALIDALVRAGKKVVVILYGGSPVELPFESGVSAILNMYLPGQNGGEAAAELVFGDKTPCGKLAETWPMSYDDVPFGGEFSKTRREVYKESVFVGYRYYLTAGKKVRYPFGYGLSYTSFEYSDMAVFATEDGVTVTATVTNTGSRFGGEIAQLYVKSPSPVFKPLRELKGFTKVYLNPAQSARIEIKVGKEDLSYWDMGQNRFVTAGGEYLFELCRDAQSVCLSQPLTIDGEAVEPAYCEEVGNIYRAADLAKVSDGVFEKMSGIALPALPPSLPITLESRFSDLQGTRMGRLLYGAVISVAEHDLKKAQKLPEGAERDNRIKAALFMKRVMISNSLITMSMSAGRIFPYNLAQGFACLSNGQFFRGLGHFCRKVKAPALPKSKEGK